MVECSDVVCKTFGCYRIQEMEIQILEVLWYIIKILTWENSMKFSYLLN